MITFKNSKLISKQNLHRLKSLGNFIVDKFFSKKKKKKLKIRIVFVKNLFKDNNMFANCVWEDDYIRPNEFTIQVDPDQKIQLLLNSFAHEFVHVKQWAKGEYYELQSKPKVYKFNGKQVDTQKIDYWDTPWEIEAYGRAIGLVVQWTRKENLSGQKLVLEG